MTSISRAKNEMRMHKMLRNRRITGKFWPAVRARTWEKAEELFAQDFYVSHDENITRPTRHELREGGCFYHAKCLVLREVNIRLRGARSQERQDEDAFQDYERRFGGQ